MKPRKRFNYVYVVQNLYFYRRDYIEFCMTPHLTDMDVFTSFEDAQKALGNDYKYWCENLATTQTYIQVKKPSSCDAGSFYEDYGGYSVDYGDEHGTHYARVGKLFRYRL